MTQPHSRPNLLIVDDTPVNIQILIAMLQHDYEVCATLKQEVGVHLRLARQRVRLAELKQYLRDGRPFDGSTVNYRKDGQPYCVEWNISPVHGPHGHITARFNAEQELARAGARALESSRPAHQPSASN